MARIKVAGMNIMFQYASRDFFDPLVKPYVIDTGEIHHTITTHIEHTLQLPNHIILINSYATRNIYEDETSRYIVGKSEDGNILQYIKHTLDYREIDMYLSDQYKKEIVEEIEYVLSGQIFIEIALLHHVFAFHAAAVEIDNHAVLFAAPSGTGKSTHASYWLTSKDAMIINGDKPLIHVQNNQFVVSGSPWCGKEFLHRNVTVPLHAIVLLERGNNTIKQVPTKEKLIALLKHAARPRNEDMIDTIVTIAEQLINKIPIMNYQASHSIASVNPIYDHLFGGSQNEN